MGKSKKPSKGLKVFTDSTLKIFDPTFTQYGFEQHLIKLEEYFVKIIYRKDNQYVKISGSIYPTDYPYSYNVILGDGDSDDFWESDWNSIALWKIKNKINPELKPLEYDFPFGNSVSPSLKKANQELIKYAKEFLNGDLELFIKIRKEQNNEREPYKIHSPDENGNYKTTDEPKSVEQKKKYS